MQKLPNGNDTACPATDTVVHSKRSSAVYKLFNPEDLIFLELRFDFDRKRVTSSTHRQGEI